MAGMAVRALTQAILPNADPNDPGTLTQVEQLLVSGDPNALAALKQGEQDFLVEMRKLGIEEESLHQKDRASARTMATNTTIVPQMVLGTLFIGGYFIILWALLTGQITLAEAVKDMAFILIGVLTGEVPRIMAFFFGSSTGSKSKFSDPKIYKSLD